jgi:hypothetical protein
MGQTMDQQKRKKIIGLSSFTFIVYVNAYSQYERSVLSCVYNFANQLNIALSQIDIPRKVHTAIRKHFKYFILYL